MEIKLTLNELRNSLKSLNDISNKDGLDFKFNYRIAKISKTIEPVVRVYEKTLKDFLNQNGIKDSETGVLKLNTSDVSVIDKFNSTNEELLNEEHEIDIQKIDINMFTEYDIKASDIRNLLWMIEGDL